MTRVNTVEPALLSGPHLVAEYREITRVFALSAAAHCKSTVSVPPSYRMGAGHVTFFYDKLGFIERRHRSLVEEMQRRGYKPTILEAAAGWRDKIPAIAWRDWMPSAADVATNLARLVEREPEFYNKLLIGA